MAQSVGNYRITGHALAEMERRGIDESIVRRVLAALEQRHAVRPGRDVLQSRVTFGDKTCLVRAFVDRKPVKVVTVYRTSKIAKYWRGEP